MGELICQLQQYSEVEIGTNAVRCLAYADDLLPFARTRDVAKSKALCLRTVASKKKVYVDVGIEEYLKYLGAEFTAFGMGSQNNEALFIHLKRLKRASLKPSQKLLYYATSSYQANYPLEVVKSAPGCFKTGIYYGWANVDNVPVYKMVMSIGWNPYYSNKEKSMVNRNSIMQALDTLNKKAAKFLHQQQPKAIHLVIILLNEISATFLAI
uniref:riboflavin kinase n=1 Tax=Glossina brevipalpis TaxID=37001 RepID=A0A1A9W9R8_9MUSC